MTRAQCIVYRGNRILMVKHRMNDQEWWCLPGGGVKPGETAQEGALRELEEECCVTGEIQRETAHYDEGNSDDTITFLVEIGNQEPRMGVDPEFERENQILADLQWLRLVEIPERDRAYLWAAGLLSIPEFLEEISGWGDDLSYPTS